MHGITTGSFLAKGSGGLNKLAAFPVQRLATSRRTSSTTTLQTKVQTQTRYARPELLSLTRPAAVQGIKLGDFQATVSAFISAGLFFVISSAKPLDKLSRQRPHPNIFCAYVFLSMLGQFALHTAFLMFVYSGAVAIMPKVSFQAHTSMPMPLTALAVHWGSGQQAQGVGSSTCPRANTADCFAGEPAMDAHVHAHEVSRDPAPWASCQDAQGSRSSMRLHVGHACASGLSCPATLPVGACGMSSGLC